MLGYRIFGLNEIAIGDFKEPELPEIVEYSGYTRSVSQELELRRVRMIER